MAPELATPSSLAEALDELRDEEALPLAGGTALVILLRNRLIAPSRLVWLQRLPDLDVIRPTAGGVSVGAMVTVDRLCHEPIVRRDFPALASAASRVGNLRVRCAATVGGHVAHADPRQDLPPVLVAMDAGIRVQGLRSTRVVPAAGFFRGTMETAVEAGELVTSIELPAPSPGGVVAYHRFNPGSEEDYPTVSVAVAMTRDPEGRVTAVRLALGGVADRPSVVADAEGLLVGRRPGPDDVRAVADAAAEGCEPSSDGRGSAPYKRAMAAVWTRRVLTSLLAG